MFNRKKTVYESQLMQPHVTVDKIRKELRDMILKEKARLASLERSKQFEKRMKECERLNELIKADNPDDLTYLLGRPDATQRENPFYMALQAQKKERDKYKQLLHLAIENEIISSNAQS